MNFFMTVVDKRVKPDSALRKVDAPIDWQRLAARRIFRPCGWLHGTKGACRQGAVKHGQPHLPCRSGGPVGDHVSGCPGTSPVPAPRRRGLGFMGLWSVEAETAFKAMAPTPPDAAHLGLKLCLWASRPLPKAP